MSSELLERRANGFADLPRPEVPFDWIALSETDPYRFSRCKFATQQIQLTWNQGKQVVKTVGLTFENDDGDLCVLQVLLILKILIDRDESVEGFSREPK